MNKRQRKKYNESYSSVQMIITPKPEFKWDTYDDVLDCLIDHAEWMGLGLFGSFNTKPVAGQFTFHAFVTGGNRTTPIEPQVRTWVESLTGVGLDISWAQAPTEVNPRTFRIKQKSKGTLALEKQISEEWKKVWE